MSINYNKSMSYLLHDVPTDSTDSSSSCNALEHLPTPDSLLRRIAFYKSGQARNGAKTDDASSRKLADTHA